MTPNDLAALCIFQEAGNQPPEGRRAIGVVILHRMAEKSMSDENVEGTVLANNQFSWTQWEMIGGKYTKVAQAGAQQLARVQQLLGISQASKALWADCVAAWAEV